MILYFCTELNYLLVCVLLRDNLHQLPFSTVQMSSNGYHTYTKWVHFQKREIVNRASHPDCIQFNLLMSVYLTTSRPQNAAVLSLFVVPISKIKPRSLRIKFHTKTLIEIAMVLSKNRGSFPSNSHVSATFSILLRFGEFCNPTHCEKLNADGSLMGRTNLDKSVW